MTQARKQEPKSRRDLMRTAGQGAGAVIAGAAAALTGTSAAATAPSAEPDAGYRETPHIKRYYELASF